MARSSCCILNQVEAGNEAGVGSKPTSICIAAGAMSARTTEMKAAINENWKYGDDEQRRPQPCERKRR
jgi:hypothetical protein